MESCDGWHLSRPWPTISVFGRFENGGLKPTLQPTLQLALQARYHGWYWTLSRRMFAAP